MNSSTLFLAIGGVEEELLRRSDRTAPKRSRLLRLGILAASLCLVVTLTVPAVRDFLKAKGGEPTDPIAALEYGGKFYEAEDDPAVLEKYGLPREITADMAGQHLTYLEGDRDHGYRCTAYQTDKALYLYAPAPGDAVYVLRDGEVYMAAIFCNFYQFDSNTSCELTELFRVYRIADPEDIVSITEVDWHREKVIGPPLTARQEIGAFYDQSVSLWSYGNDDFQRLMFGGFSSEEALQEAYTAFAEDSRVLRVVTADGLRFYLDFHPAHRWLYGGGTMSYFRIDESLLDWFTRNFN